MKVLALIFTFSLTLYAQECTHQWDIYFDTNPLHSKYLSGDTATGYGVFNYWGDPNLVLKIEGQFPKSRFLSFESEATELAINEDHLFDYEMVANEGSRNPFLPGEDIATTNRSYTAWAMQNPPAGRVNTFRLPSGRLTQAIMYRVYSPNEGVKLTRKDLPRVFAYNRYTGQSTSCPRFIFNDPKFYFPQFLAGIYTLFTPFEFKQPENMTIAGLNKAAGYAFALTPLSTNEVVVVKFKAPTFFNSHSGKGIFSLDSQVRYWSFCTSNLPKNQTLNCLPDFKSKPDSKGYVTVVVGTGDSVKKKAEQQGYSFLPDARQWTQKVMGFVYRNLVVREDFKEKDMYQGEYLPHGKVCSRNSFLAGSCR